MIPAVTPTFSSTSRPTAAPEVPRDTSTSHVPLGSHVIHPRAPSRTLPRDPVSRPRWLRPQMSPPTPPSPPVPEPSSDDPRIDSAVVMEEPSLLKRMVARLPWRWAPDPNDLMDID